MTRGGRCGSQRRRAVEGLRNPEVAVVNFSRATGAGAEVDQTPSARHGIEFSIFQNSPIPDRGLGSGIACSGHSPSPFDDLT